MRAIAAAILLLASLLIIPGLHASGEPAAKQGIFFSVPFNCGTEGRKEFCLADSFKPALNAILVCDWGICTAKTGAAFIYQYAEEFEATRLEGLGECSRATEVGRFLGHFDVAIIGTQPAAVRVVSPMHEASAISKDMELKARAVAKSPTPEPCYSGPRELHKYVSDSPPKALRVGNAVLLIFQYTKENLGAEGPPVLLINDDIFRLCGLCPSSPLFFFVNDKLHLAYWATVSCCGCGDSNFFVYDLSDAAPEMVYSNGNFSD